MNHSQGYLVSMATMSHPNEDAKELSRLIYLSNKTLPMVSQKDLIDESAKHVLNTIAEYESSHESTPFSINDAEYLTAYLLRVISATQDRKTTTTPKTTSTVTNIHAGKLH